MTCLQRRRCAEQCFDTAVNLGLLRIPVLRVLAGARARTTADAGTAAALHALAQGRAHDACLPEVPGRGARDKFLRGVAGRPLDRGTLACSAVVPPAVA